jgi:HEAT repeat protein
VRHEPPDEEWTKWVRSILSDPSWREQADSDAWSRELAGLVALIPGDVRNELILDLVRDPGLPVFRFGPAIEIFSPDSAQATEVVRAIIDRWYNSGDGGSIVKSLLRTMSNYRHLADHDVLSRAARDPRYAEMALRVIGALRDPAYLPVIEGILRESSNSHTLSKAAEALSGHLSDEAAELLLVAAAKLPAGELRDGCLAQLEKIREYQDAKSRWATRKVQAQTREQVVAELIKLLDAKETEKRVQAIRGLATWEAVETMPRLIQLLSDPNKDVAAAAREALARMNAPKGE